MEEIEILRNNNIFDNFICDEIQRHLIQSRINDFRPVCDELKQYINKIRDMTPDHKPFNLDKNDFSIIQMRILSGFTNFPYFNDWQLPIIRNERGYNCDILGRLCKFYNYEKSLQMYNTRLYRDIFNKSFNRLEYLIRNIMTMDKNYHYDPDDDIEE